MSHQPTLLHDETSAEQATRDAERAKYLEHLRAPDFRAIEGFPIGDDDAILEIYDAMQHAMDTDQPYQTLLDPPPADPRGAHPQR